MREKFARPRKKRKVLISIIIGFVILGILVTFLAFLSRFIAGGAETDPDIRRFAEIRILIIILIAFDGILLFQWLFLAIFRSD